MRIHEGQVDEIQVSAAGQLVASINCPPKARPSPGRYLLAWARDETDAPLAAPIFCAEIHRNGFITASPIPNSWQPGTNLLLRGPLGRGFDPPGTARRYALAALGETIDRLQPLLLSALELDAAIALYTNTTIPSLPPAVEIHPLNNLSEALTWADYLALDVPYDKLPIIRQIMKDALGALKATPPAQALVGIAMPCGGIADCGACSMFTRQGWKQVCNHGPVFDLAEILSDSDV